MRGHLSYKDANKKAWKLLAISPRGLLLMICPTVYRLREESRRLLQERAENQQVIQLLEMQKNILAKTVRLSLLLNMLDDIVKLLLLLILNMLADTVNV